jgi:hypothetical protein
MTDVRRPYAVLFAGIVFDDSEVTMLGHLPKDDGTQRHVKLQISWSITPTSCNIYSLKPELTSTHCP